MNRPLQSFKTDQWQKDVADQGCNVVAIREMQSITKRNGDPLFSLLDVDVTAPEGYRLPHIVFIRGHATVVIPFLINSDTGEERFLMVRQRRVGNGMLTLEFPAGMLDHQNDDPADVAVKELFEETGLRVEKKQLRALSKVPLYSSAGASDEAIYYFGCKIELPGSEYTAFHLRYTGNFSENEHITVELVERAKAEPHITSLQARLGFFLFDQHFCS